MVRFVAAMTLTCFVAAPESYAAPLPVGGHTEASAPVLGRITALIGLFGPLWLSCPRVDSLTAGEVPDGFDPSTLTRVPSEFRSVIPPPMEPVHYELWHVDGCGRRVRVVVQLWHDKHGAEQFGTQPLNTYDPGS